MSVSPPSINVCINPAWISIIFLIASGWKIAAIEVQRPTRGYASTVRRLPFLTNGHWQVACYQSYYHEDYTAKPGRDCRNAELFRLQIRLISTRASRSWRFSHAGFLCNRCQAIRDFITDVLRNSVTFRAVCTRGQPNGFPPRSRK